MLAQTYDGPETPTDLASLLIHTGVASPTEVTECAIEIPVEDISTTITGMQMLVARRYVVLILVPGMLILFLGTITVVICALIPYSFDDKIQWRNSIIGSASALAGLYILYLLAILIGAFIAPSEAHLTDSQVKFERFVVSKEGFMRFFISMIFLLGVAIWFAPLVIIVFCCFVLRCCSRGPRKVSCDCHDIPCHSFLDVFDFFCDCGRCGDCGCSPEVLVRCFCCLVTDFQDMKGPLGILRCLNVLTCLFYCLYCTNDRSYVYAIDKREREIIKNRQKRKRKGSSLYEPRY
jgi:hypothetical protein